MGIGATLAGGCTTGGFFVPLTFSSAAGWAMWTGLLVGAVIFFAWSGSTAGAIIGNLGLLTPDFDIDFLDGVAEITGLGFQAFMPDLFGDWEYSLLLTYVLLVVWYIFVRYNEATSKSTVF